MRDTGGGWVGGVGLGVGVGRVGVFLGYTAEFGIHSYN